MPRVAELLRDLDGMPGDSPVRDLEVLLGHCLGKSRTWLYTWPDTELQGADLARFEALRERRRGGEPVAYLTGERAFWSLDLQVAPCTLIPRPETESLVEWALQLPLDRRISALDLGTGTGAIALALASERPNWELTGVDSSESAVALARRNAAANQLQRVQFLRSDWMRALPGRRYDLIVSNPPYVDPEDPHLERGDLRFEPRSALVAAEHGLADLAHIIDAAPDYLSADGWLLLEHGFEQGDAVRERLRYRGFHAVETRRDLAGLERISGGHWRAQ